jgi:RNA polymerase sigma factor (sigma-70 family)
MSLTNVDDATLLTLVGGGDNSALAELFDRHAPAVTRYAWSLATSRFDAEELVQDTFVTLWSSAQRVRINASALPWLLVTCRNHARNMARKRARENTAVIRDDDVAPGDSGAARDELRWVMAEISRLDPIDQRVCELCLIEGRPYKEAAALLGTSVGAIKQRVSRVRTRLRKVAFENEH